MPHNRTRTWVGLAILAITIPAVGTYYAETRSGERQAGEIRIARRQDASNEAVAPTVSAPSRDYRAALEKALARSGPRLPTEALPGTDDDPTFDLDPYGTDAPEEGTVASDDTPEPIADLAPANPTEPATSDENPAPVAAAANPEPVADLASTGEMSDRDVYTLVANNLSAEDRDEFVRAYAAMTPGQRADLLDGFRQQIQGNDR